MPDSHARLSFGSGTHAVSIFVVGAHIFVLDPAGSVYIYGDKSFEEVHQLRHGERTRLMQFNSTGTLVAACGFASTRVWNVSDGTCIASANNPTRRARPQSMAFLEDDTTLMLGSDDGRVCLWRIADSWTEWEVIAEVDEQHLEGTFVNSPSCMAISPDGNQVALGYRGHPASVWEVQGPNLVGHCSRRDAENAWGEVVQIT
jgi:WD40 repeat protein